MEKYIIRVFSINLKKLNKSIKKSLGQYGTIYKVNKVIFKNKNYELFIKIQMNDENFKALKQIEIKNSLPEFKINLIKNIKYTLDNVDKKVFLNKFPNKISKKEIFESFRSYGKIKKIILCNNNKNNNYFFFIYYYKKESVLKFLKDYTNHYINEKWIEVKLRRNNIKNKAKDTILDKKLNQCAKKAHDDFSALNKLSLFTIIKNNKRSNSVKSLSNKNVKITKFNLVSSNFSSKKNTGVLKKQLATQIIKNLI